MSLLSSIFLYTIKVSVSKYFSINSFVIDRLAKASQIFVDCKCFKSSEVILILQSMILFICECSAIIMDKTLIIFEELLKFINALLYVENVHLGRPITPHLRPLPRPREPLE